MYHGDNLGKASYSDGVQPFCVGHEFTGEIVEVGKQVHRFKVGDKVLASGGRALRRMLPLFIGSCAGV
jgi:threonine dehydrogenase-like Zn-dependent dehydrogenase